MRMCKRIVKEGPILGYHENRQISLDGIMIGLTCLRTVGSSGLKEHRGYRFFFNTSVISSHDVDVW